MFDAKYRKNRKGIKLESEVWHNFTIDQQEIICKKYNVILPRYIPKSKIKFRILDKKITKYQKKVFDGIDMLVKGANTSSKMIDEVFKQFDKQFAESTSLEKPNVFADSEKKKEMPDVYEAVFGSKESKEKSDVFFGSKEPKSDAFFGSKKTKLWD